MRYGYARISAIDQQTDQLKSLQKADCQKIFKDEQVSGGQHPELTRCLRILQSADTFVVPSLNCLAHNLADLLTIVEQLKQQRVNFLSLQEGLNTATSHGPIIYQVFSALREFERNQTVKPTQTDEVKTPRGIQPRPKTKLSKKQISHAQKLIKEGKSRKAVAHSLKVARATLYRALVA